MPLNQLIALLIIAVCASTLVALLTGSNANKWGAGCLIGLLGAFLGQWIQLQMRLPSIIPVIINGTSYRIVWPMLGAFLFIFLLRFAHSNEH